MSFQQGLSGLNSSSKNLDIIGNNIANANTFGAKGSRAEFADVYAASLGGNGTSNIGIGVRLASVAQQFTQGNITTTENSLDLAINGSGFFQLTDASGGLVYSRNGQFKVDKEGYIVNNDGLKLQGYPAEGANSASISPLKLPTGRIAPKATNEIGLEFNLDSGAAAITPPASGPAIDFANPKTYNNSTSVTVYDGKGEPVAVSFYFQKVPSTPANPQPDTWNVYATANGQAITNPDGTPKLVSTLHFDTNGKLKSDSLTMPLSVPASKNSTGADTLPIGPITVDIGSSTQFGSNFAVTDLSQNGYADGQLNSIAIDSSGVIMARYSNGQSQSAGRLELATFRNNQGLQPIGGNGWISTFASGERIPGMPGDGNNGVIQAGALEESNVDLTAELVNMITAQRNYQANAQTIKTLDQVMQTLVNMR